MTRNQFPLLIPIDFYKSIFCKIQAINLVKGRRQILPIKTIQII